MSVWQVHVLANGRFSVRFRTPEGRDLLAPMENIPSSIFLLRSGDRFLLVDTGFDPLDVGGLGSSASQKREERLEEALEAAGLAPREIGDVVMTHLHWDHTAGMGLFPHARFHVQADVFRAFNALNPNEETYYRPDHWLSLLDQMVLVEGDVEILPGIKVRRTGGHCPGHQVVLVETGKGVLALAGDLPYDYSGLWSALPEDFWEAYRKGAGKGFWWTETAWEKLAGFMEARGLLGAPSSERELNFSKLRRSCTEVLLTHDPGLYAGSLRQPA